MRRSKSFCSKAKRKGNLISQKVGEGKKNLFINRTNVNCDRIFSLLLINEVDIKLFLAQVICNNLFWGVWEEKGIIGLVERDDGYLLFKKGSSEIVIIFLKCL